MRPFSLLVATGINQEGYREIFEAPDVSTARHIVNLMLEVFSVKAPRAMDILEDGFRLKTVLNTPVRYRKRLRTTRGVVRLNQKIRRRERVVRIFPNRKLALRRVRKSVVDRTGRNMVNEARSTSRWMNIGNGRNRDRNINNSMRQVK